MDHAAHSVSYLLKGLFAWLVFSLCAACGSGGQPPTGGGGGGGGGGTPSDPPVTIGTWYRPTVTTSWQWQLSGTVNTGYDVALYDVDLFDSPDQLISDLHTASRKVICYFSAGSYEEWRPDAGQYLPADLGNNLSGWAGERWVDIRSANVRTILLARLDLAQQRGCDGVEPDNMDGYTNNSGFALTAQDQLDFNAFLANAAHERGLAVGLKNDLDQIEALVDYFDFSVNEQCNQYNECDRLTAFVSAGKPVFNAEYANTYVNDSAARQALCDDARTRNFRTLVLPVALDDAYRLSCD